MSACNAPVVSFDDEPLICVDAQDQEIGHASKAVCHDGDGRLHRALSVFVFNSAGKILLQQRSHEKRLWPLWWANSCCSHPRRGEAIGDAAVRRVQQELNLNCQLHRTHHFTYHAKFADEGSEHELCHVFVGATDAVPEVNPHEVRAVRWVTTEELDACLLDVHAPYTPWLRLEWEALRKNHWTAVEAAIAALRSRQDASKSNPLP